MPDHEGVPATGIRKIIHSDCDCFYAAIETRDDPRLEGRPVAVGGQPDRRGVVASCNYPARAAGVRSAQPMAQALRLCPDLVIVRPAMEKYRAASRAILAIYHDYTPLVEPLSLDEAFLDVTATNACAGSATRIARAIKARVRSSVGITVSTGVAPNKFLAKVASAWQKPDGLTVIPPARVDTFVAALPVEKLHGVGQVTAARLHDHGLVTCADVRARSRLELRALCGTLGDRLYELARGIDRRAVSPHQERKSLSVEETYVTDLMDIGACRSELDALLQSLGKSAARLEKRECIASIFVKIRFDNFQRTTAERAATSLDRERFLELLETAYGRGRRPVRLLGVGARIGRGAPYDQMTLFEESPPGSSSSQGNPT